MHELRFPEGPWRSLFQRTMNLFDEIELTGIKIPQWSLGGGTVLMFHYQHRLSKDIDIFVTDPQFLGYINPRLGGPAESLTTEYAESANYIKLYFSEGEIDVIATTPLTKNPFIRQEVLGRSILLETPIEIVAKKIWHRGDVANARDLFDLALVVGKEGDGIRCYPEVFQKNALTFVEQCKSRKNTLEMQYDQIEKIGFQKSYAECLDVVEGFFRSL